jgi:hypothetical protein
MEGEGRWEAQGVGRQPAWNWAHMRECFRLRRTRRSGALGPCASGIAMTHPNSHDSQQHANRIPLTLALGEERDVQLRLGGAARLLPAPRGVPVYVASHPVQVALLRRRGNTRHMLTSLAIQCRPLSCRTRALAANDTCDDS